MQKIKFRYFQHLYGTKSILILALILSASMAKAQYYECMNLEGHDQKKYYFGIVLGYNTSHYNVTHHPYFLQQDTVMTVNSLNSGRIHLGIMANWQVSN